MICKSCGSENEEGNVFCMNCGARLEEGSPDAETTAESESVTEPETEPEPQPIPEPIATPRIPIQDAPVAPLVPPVAAAPEYKQPAMAPQAPKGPPDTCRTLRMPVAPDMPGLSFFDGTTGQYFGYLVLFGILNTLIVALPVALVALFGGLSVSGLKINDFNANINIDLVSISVLQMILLIAVGVIALLLGLLVMSWMYTVLIRWMSHHTIVNDHRLVFIGHPFDLFKKLLIYWLLCLITAGIFSIWVPVKLLRWKASNTRFAT